MPDYKAQSKTKISRKASTYMESAEKYLGTSRTLKAKFGKLKKTINAILQKTTELETANEEGMLPLMSGQDITTLTSLYDEALKDVLAVAKLGEEKGHGKDSAFFKSVEKVADFLNSDKKKLATYDEKQPMALSDFIVSTKANYVDLTNVDKQSMSGACNSRIPIEVTLPGAEEGVKGVFTEEKILTSKDRYDLVRQALNYDVLNQFFGSFRGDETEKANRFCQFFSEISMERDEAGDVKLNLEKHQNTVVGLAFSRILDGYKNMAKTGTDEEKHAGNVFFDYLIDMTNKMKKLVTSEGILVSSGVNYGGNINKRNCAMSAVAEALGMPHIIAKSVPMTVKVGENEYKTGTFMQLAKGSDPDEKYITSDDPILTLSPESTQSKNCFQAVKDAADLQVLDFICGNVDRHTNNMFYQVENGKIIGIQGIDNDSAFGVIDKDVLLGNRSHLQFVGISNMKIMDVKTAKRVLDMTPEYLRKTISGFGLRPYEIDAACERLKLLQNSLDDSYLKHPDQIPTRFGNKRIYVLNDNQMKRINLSREIGVTIEEEGIRRPGNAFSQIHGIISRIIKMKNKERETRKRIAGEEKEFKQVTVGQRNQGPDFAKYGRALDKHISAMENVNHGMFFASPEFKNVLAYAKYMKREMEAMSQEGINEQNVSKAYNMFENLVTLNSLYLNHKNTDGSLNSKERARNRALAVNELQDMASNYVTRFGLNEREQYRHLCQRMRISSAQRKRDNRTIADAIQRLTAQGAAGGEEEPRFVQVIDGIRARRAEAVQVQAGLNR